MRQLEFFDIPSPCIGVCQSGPKGYCLGCYRSRDERLHWLQLDDDVKRKVIKAARLRKRRAEQQRDKENESINEASSQGALFDEFTEVTPGN